LECSLGCPLVPPPLLVSQWRHVALLLSTPALRLLEHLRDAVSAARAAYGAKPSPPLFFPVTAERIRMACVDSFTERVLGVEAAATAITKSSY
jgi:hypothetical protein